MSDLQQTQEQLREHQQALYVLLQEFHRVCSELNIPYILFSGTMLGAVRHQDFIPWDDDLDIMMLRADYDRFLREAEGVLDRERFFLQKEFSEHWPVHFSKLRLNGTTCLEKYHPNDPKRHQGIYMDLFPCDEAAKTALGRRIQFLASKVVIAKCLDARSYDTDSRLKKLFMAACRLLPLKPFVALTKGKKNTGTVHGFYAASSRFSKSVYRRSWFEKKMDAAFHGGMYPIPQEYDEFLTTLYGDYMTLPPEEERQVKVHAILVDTRKSYEHYLHYRDDMTFDVHTKSIR